MSARPSVHARHRRRSGGRGNAAIASRDSSFVTSSTPRHAAVFLDRDGTIIEDVDYLNRFEDVQFFPSTVDAIRALNRAGFLVVVVTNQSGVARGKLTEPFLANVHALMARTLEAGGA